MTAQNTKTIQYRLRNGQSVEVTINNDGVHGEKVSISDLAIEKTIMCHLGFTEEVSKKAWCSYLAHNGYWHAQIHYCSYPLV